MRSRQSGKERTNEINEPNRQRRARREGGEERHIDLLPPAYFEAFRDAATGAVQELWLPGGRYSGKSTFVARCIAALEATRGFEDCHAACFRRHQVDIRESIGTELQLAVDALGVGGLWAVKHSPFRLVRRDTGQTIFFYGLDDPRKHKSKKPPFGSVRWLWFEEADEFDCWDDIENVQNSFQRNGEVLWLAFSTSARVQHSTRPSGVGTR